MSRLRYRRIFDVKWNEGLGKRLGIRMSIELLSAIEWTVLRKSVYRRGAEGRAEDRRELSDFHINQITQVVIGAAMEVHRQLGPGLVESAYVECLSRELTLRGINYERQRALPVEYKGVRLECGYRLELIDERSVVVEVKSIEALAPVHEAQLITYLRLGG